MQQRVLHVYPDPEILADRAAAALIRIADAYLDRNETFHLVLAGGGTPRLLYERLAAAHSDWTRWHLWYGDERCLPPDHPDRNSTLVAKSWLDRVGFPAANHHPIPAELGAEEGARRYAAAVQGIGNFSLVLLGLGEDGHTASLFPGDDWPGAAADALPVANAPKPPAARISLSAARLARADGVFFLVSGAGKQDALRRWLGGARLPAAAICPASGVEIFADRAACEV